MNDNSERFRKSRDVDLVVRDGVLNARTEEGDVAVDDIVKCFPFSDRSRWISFRDHDGRELAIKASLSDLEPDVREHVEGVLEEKYHIPMILRIISIRPLTGYDRWEVETVDGVTEFSHSGDSGTDVSAFPRILLTSLDTGRRYEIPDYTNLSRSSQLLARAHLPIAGGRRRRR